MAENQRQKWLDALAQVSQMSCGRLDMNTYLPAEATAGRVTSDRVRYVYFEGEEPEVICLGTMADYVAFAAGEYQDLRAKLTDAEAKFEDWEWKCNKLNTEALIGEIRELRAKLTEAQADSKRLDWLDQNMDCDLSGPGLSVDLVRIGDDETLREAIDSAIHAVNQPTEEKGDE